MGDGSRGFVTRALTVATQNGDIPPRSFDVNEMRGDLELLDSLRPILNALSQLSELVEDTYTAVGSEAYSSALLICQYARSGAPDNDDSAFHVPLSSSTEPFGKIVVRLYLVS